MIILICSSTKVLFRSVSNYLAKFLGISAKLFFPLITVLKKKNDSFYLLILPDFAILLWDLYLKNGATYYFMYYESLCIPYHVRRLRLDNVASILRNNVVQRLKPCAVAFKLKFIIRGNFTGSYPFRGHGAPYPS